MIIKIARVVKVLRYGQNLFEFLGGSTFRRLSISDPSFLEKLSPSGASLSPFSPGYPFNRGSGAAN